jgi:hypothetical protein
VELEVYPGEDFFDARAGIVATVPGADDDAKIAVTDDGCLTWTRGYWPGATIIESGPEFCGWITNPAVVARSVVEAVTRGMSQLHLAGDGRAGRGQAGAERALFRRRNLTPAGAARRGAPGCRCARRLRGSGGA